MDYLRRTWADIDLDCIVHNYRELKSRLTPGCRTMAVVKADAYGHGDGYVSRALQREGADWFAVSNINEAISLRRQEVARPILILGCTPPEMAHTLAELASPRRLFGGVRGGAFPRRGRTEGRDRLPCEDRHGNEPHRLFRPARP